MLCLPIAFLILILAKFNLWFLVLLLFCFFILGFNYEYVISKDGIHTKVLRIFKVAFYIEGKLILNSDYITVMEQAYVDRSNFSWYPNIFGDVKYKYFVIKFFKGKNYQTVFQTSSKEEVLLKTKQLSEVLNLRVNNALKDSST